MRLLAASFSYLVCQQGFGLTLLRDSSVSALEHRRAVRHFAKFQNAHGRQYQQGTVEYQQRMALFQKRFNAIRRFNSRPLGLWMAGINKFADRTDKELASLHGWKRSPAVSMGNPGLNDWSLLETSAEVSVQLPKSHSYRGRHNAFIRNQGGCGSCWAIAAATTLSYHSELYASNLTFSPQELVSCVPNQKHCGGGGGCDGATVELAMQYITTRGLKEPLTTSYTATAGSCKAPLSAFESEALSDVSPLPQTHKAPADSPGRDFGLTGWRKLRPNAYEPLMVALFTRGPVAVTIAATSLTFYNEGIFDCQDPLTLHSDWIINHAVTLIGYGTDEDRGKKYWLVQNSWGPDWGEGGMVRILRRDDEEAHCGVDTKPQDGSACEGEDEPITVCGTCGILFDPVLPIFERH